MAASSTGGVRSGDPDASRGPADYLALCPNHRIDPGSSDLSVLPPLFPTSKPDRVTPAPPARRRSWSGLAASVVVHGLVVVMALLLSRHEAQQLAEKRAEMRSDTTRQQVIPFYVPPPPPAPPPPPQPQHPVPPPLPPPVRRVAPPPDTRQPTPEPEPNAPPEERRSRGADTPDETDPGAHKAPDRAAEATAPQEIEYATAPTLESEARRIFGMKRAAPTPGAGPRDVRPLLSELPTDSTKCVRRPRDPTDSSKPPEFGVAVGRIFRQNDRRPLAGAHLQMIGTPYTAFTDDAGEYHFRFDMSLVDFCRTQYVRVTAPGYESRLLVLMVGLNVRSDDVSLRRQR